MSGRKSNLSPELAEKARADLNSIYDGKPAIRLLAISKCAEMPVKSVASFLNTTRETVSRWIRAYLEKGIEGLRDSPKGHRNSKINDSQASQIEQWLDSQTNFKGEAVNWTIEKLRTEIKEVFDISISYTPLRLFVRKLNFRQKVPHPVHIKADNEAQEAYKKK